MSLRQSPCAEKGGGFACFLPVMSLTQEFQWVAAYTSPRAEKTVTSRIAQELRLETYLPLHRVLHKWSDRVKCLELPLIPSYTFVRMRECDLWRVREIRGVCGFVSFPSTGISVIPDLDMVNLRRFAESLEEVRVHNLDQLQVGAYVKVRGGEFSGMEGRIVRDDRAGNFAVEISGLNLFLTVTVQQEYLLVVDAPKPQSVGLLYK